MWTDNKIQAETTKSVWILLIIYPFFVDVNYKYI